MKTNKYVYYEYDSNLSKYELTMNNDIICIEASTLGEANIIDTSLIILIDKNEGWLQCLIEQCHEECDIEDDSVNNGDEGDDVYMCHVSYNMLYDYIYKDESKGIPIELKNGVLFAGRNKLNQKPEIKYDLEKIIKELRV